MEVKVKEVVRYGGHSVSANGTVNLTLKAGYGELVKTINVMSMLNNDVTMKAKMPSMSPMKLGSFRVKQIVVHDDGESTLKFNGIIDYVEVDNLNALSINNVDGNNEFAVLLVAEIESEGIDEGDGEQGEDDAEGADE